VDEGAPYDSTYLLTLRHRTPECRRDAMAHLGSYLFHELTTPLGLRLDRARAPAARSSRRQAGGGKGAAGPSSAYGGGFRSLGTYGVWFPRGLLLRLTARSACARVLEDWQAAGEPSARAELEAVRARVQADSELQPEVLAARVGELASAHLEGRPREVLTRLLAALEEQSQQSVAQDDPAAWARLALTRVEDWLGGGLPPPGVTAVQQRKSRLTKALEAAASKLAAEWDQRLGALVAGLLEHPGRRLAVGEAALTSFLAYCDEAAAAQSGRCDQQAQRSQHLQEQLQAALAGCAEGGLAFSWFGGRSRRALRVFVDHLAAFARQCLTEDTQAAVQQFFGFLRGRLSDRLRDLTFCRQRLRHMQESLQRMFTATGGPDDAALAGPALSGGEDWVAPPSRGGAMDVTAATGPTPVVSAESFWEALRGSSTMRVVLPPEARNLEDAAAAFLTTLTAEVWAQLDQAFQDHVLGSRGGLQRACLATNDLSRHLAVPLLNQAVSCLSAHLPITDVAQVELSREEDRAARIHAYHRQAVPLLGPHEPQPSRQPRPELTGSGVREKVPDAVAACRRRPTAAGGGPPSPGWYPPDPQVSGSTPLRPPAPADDCFLLIPASDAGKRYGEEALQALPAAHLVTVPGQADLMFCREQGALHLEDLEKVLSSCRAAYGELAVVPNSSPHARFDIQDWVPLDP
jgi:hypothetical protein